MSYVWSQENKDKLLKMISDGVSPSDAASKIGVTRDSVDGMMRRMKIKSMAVKKCEVIAEKSDWITREFPIVARKNPLPMDTYVCGLNNFKTHLVFGDSHLESDGDNSILELVIRFIKANRKYDSIVLAGDFMNLACISHWNKGKPGAIEGQRLRADYTCAQNYIDHIKPHATELVYMIGNHEDWVEQACQETPAYRGFIDIMSNIHNVDTWIPNNGVHRIGRLRIVHGLYCNEFAAKKHLFRMHDNVMFFHTHRGQLYSDNIYGVRPIAAWNIGGTCSMNPEYAKGTEPNWQHQFAIVTEDVASGTFWVEVVWIIDKRICYGGYVYE